MRPENMCPRRQGAGRHFSLYHSPMGADVTIESRTAPLTDDEITELDELLMAGDEDRDPLDVVMLDGFLTGIVLQPDVVPPSAWLPLVFDSRGRAPAVPAEPAMTQRTHDLIMRRHNEIAAHVAAREPCDPIVLRPLLSNTFDKAFVISPPGASTARIEPVSPAGCPAPRLQLVAATPRPLVANWPQMQFKYIPHESPWPSLQTIYLTSNTSLRFSHGLQLRMTLK